MKTSVLLPIAVSVLMLEGCYTRLAVRDDQPDQVVKSPVAGEPADPILLVAQPIIIVPPPPPPPLPLPVVSGGIATTPAPKQESPRREIGNTRTGSSAGGERNGRGR